MRRLPDVDQRHANSAPHQNMSHYADGSSVNSHQQPPCPRAKSPAPFVRRPARVGLCGHVRRYRSGSLFVNCKESSGRHLADP
eukprot:2367322-Prymnesium_polylepis.1